MFTMLRRNDSFPRKPSNELRLAPRLQGRPVAINEWQKHIRDEDRRGPFTTQRLNRLPRRSNLPVPIQLPGFVLYHPSQSSRFTSAKEPGKRLHTLAPANPYRA